MNTQRIAKTLTKKNKLEEFVLLDIKSYTQLW